MNDINRLLALIGIFIFVALIIWRLSRSGKNDKVEKK